MRLKTYTVNNLAEGMAQIKRDLGEEALILNTKKVKTRGFLGLFSKEKLEIIAAIEQKPATRERQVKKESYVEMPDSARKDEAEHTEGVSNEELLVAKVKATRESKTSSENDATLTNELMQELKNIKKMMVQVMEDDRLPESLKTINNQWIRQEISPGVRSELLAKLMFLVGQNPNYTNEQVKDLARNELIQFISKHFKTPETKNSEMICFVGPTGVGKTTTIAKMAADYLLNRDKKVGLITSDTYRIAAVEQLKTYAAILNIPIQVVQSPSDMKQAMSELSSSDLILMDTAGRNYQQQEYMNELERLLSDQDKIQINLVLSLTSKYEDMKKIIDQFKTMTIDQLILTKKDETSSYGAIINLLSEYQVPLRYITTGQNVPDDIVELTPELLANFLLGEDEND
jgi:flagellar biosynthesis protein FlhF